MMAEFSVHLGGGLYMDSDGVLTHGTDPGKPVYATPGGSLPATLDALGKAFQGLAKGLPNADEPKSREKFDDILDGIGMALADKEHLIDVLQAIGAAASVIGSVVPIVGAAIAVLTLLLGVFKGGPSALELMITKRFDDLARQLKSLEAQIWQRDLRDQRAQISAALDAFSNYVFELKNTPPDKSTLALRHHEMRQQADNAGIAVRRLLDTSTWLTSFDQSDYSNVWQFLQGRLFTFPHDGPPTRAIMPAQGANTFDHSLMVPLNLFAITSYLTILRALTPEFRSTREHREELWVIARDLQTLTENMRAEGLARTVYTAGDFQGDTGGLPFGIPADEVVDLSAFGLPPFLKPNSNRFTVGAMDLRIYNNAYFTPGFTAGPIRFEGDQYSKQGLLNVRWMPPAELESYQMDVPVSSTQTRSETRYRITNPQVCALAANAQAELDYANLLYSSGYLNLVHLIAVVRNEATDPAVSQTVRVVDTWLRRKPGTAVPVTVESEPNFLTGVISSPAQQEPQQYKASVDLTTQPLGRDRPLRYKVWLRTLPVGYSQSRWTDQGYASFYHADYVDDAEHPGCMTLVTSVAQVIGEALIAEGPSPGQPYHANGKAALQAITHDWWLPVQPAITRFDNPDSAALRALGVEAGSGAAPRNSLVPTFSLQRDHIPAAILNAVDEFASWIDAVEPATGQHRKAGLHGIHLDYTIDWTGDQMTVSLHNDPADRNYVVYIVVEETLGSGQVLHTVQRVPVIGQLTYVPQAYFDEEKAAEDLLNKMMNDIADRYVRSVSHVPGHPAPPGGPLSGLTEAQILQDPVLREYQLGGLTTRESLERFAIQISQHPPAAAMLLQSLKDARIPAPVTLAAHLPKTS